MKKCHIFEVIFSLCEKYSVGYQKKVKGNQSTTPRQREIVAQTRAEER
jgi:hypothetical protein